MNRHTTKWLCIAALLAGCGGASAEGDPASTPPTSAKTTGSATTAQAPANQPAPAVTQLEEDSLTEAEREQLQAEWRQRLIAPYAIENEDAEAIQLLDGAFVGTERFRIRGVPAGVTFHRVGDSPPTWEVRRDGERIALVQEEEWAGVMQPEPAPETSAPLRAPAAGQRHELDDWRGRPATIVAQQYVPPLRLYRVERLSEGTEWIIRGFEYTPPDPLPNVGD